MALSPFSLSLFLSPFTYISLSPLPFVCLSFPLLIVLSAARVRPSALRPARARGLHYQLKGPTPRNVLQ